MLVSGGTDASNRLVGPSEIYDPLTGIWSVTGVLNTFRANHAAVLLQSGKVLVAGGSLDDPTSAEIYDPTSGTWTLTIAMDTPVVRASGVLLLDGRVLVAGSPNGQSPGVSSQLYDSSAGIWTPSVTIVPFVFRGVGQIEVVRLHGGMPLLAFSSCASASTCVQRAFQFDLNVGVWEAVPPEPEFSRSASFSLAALPDGRALMTGRRQLSPPSSALTTSAQLFRPDNTTPRLVVSPLTVDLGETSPGIAVRQTVTPENTGGATLTGSATTVAPFNVVSGSPFTLAPGMSTTALVEFTPSGFGEFAGVVQFMSNGNWLSVPVTGVAGVQLSGRVTDTTGAGVGGVTVNLRGASSGDTVTDATGHFDFVVSPEQWIHGHPYDPRRGVHAQYPQRTRCDASRERAGLYCSRRGCPRRVRDRPLSERLGAGPRAGRAGGMDGLSPSELQPQRI